jgi:hypothetical protein
MAPHLTFDDGPAEDTEALLDVLASFGLQRLIDDHDLLCRRLLSRSRASAEAAPGS